MLTLLYQGLEKQKIWFFETASNKNVPIRLNIWLLSNLTLFFLRFNLSSKVNIQKRINLKYSPPLEWWRSQGG